MNRLIPACFGLGCLAIAACAQAQSNVGNFNATVSIQGPVTQTATGTSVKQDLNVGSAQKSQANSFSSVVTTGSITQTGNNGAQQFINVGGMNNSKADKFDAQVSTGNIEQVAKNGEKQELDIGSVSNSTVSGKATSRVSVGSVKQTGEGEIALGAVKNSNVQQFQSNLFVKGKLEGNNIRMGSVVGQERYDNRGRDVGRELTSTEQSASLQMPNSSALSRVDQNSPLTAPGSIAPLSTPGIGIPPTPASDKYSISSYLSDRIEYLGNRAMNFEANNPFSGMLNEIIIQHGVSLGDGINTFIDAYYWHEEISYGEKIEAITHILITPLNMTITGLGINAAKGAFKGTTNNLINVLNSGGTINRENADLTKQTVTNFTDFLFVFVNPKSASLKQSWHYMKLSKNIISDTKWLLNGYSALKAVNILDKSHTIYDSILGERGQINLFGFNFCRLSSDNAY